MNFPNPTTRLRPFRPVPFGRYTLLAELAKGGMGEIFLARMEGPSGFEKLCVIKKILPHLAAEPDFVDRFVHEAKTLVKLSHGSIAQVLDMGLIDGEPYLALEYVDGKDLRKVAGRMRDRQLPAPLTVVLFVMSRVLDALAYAHRKRDDEEKEIGLVHRDISPQNILVSYEGEVKVIDFGLAKSTLSSAKTNPSIILGKFLYMSPEQAKHTGVDRRSDLYAVGLCLYELIHGKNPFDEAPAGELMSNVANPRIVPLGQVEPLLPPIVSAVVMKALAVDPAQRFQTAEEFRGKLMGCLLDIDPSAGPESVTRFMREAFATEYQAERRMLSSLREALRPPPLAPLAERAETGVLTLPRPADKPTLVTPLVTRARTRSSEGITQAELPIFPPESTAPTAPRAISAVESALGRAPGLPSSSRLSAPSRGPGLPDTQPRVLAPQPDTQPRVVPPPRAPVTLPFDDDLELHEGGSFPRPPAPPRFDPTLPVVELLADRDATQPRAEMPEPRVVIGTLLGDDDDGLSPTLRRSASRRPVLPPPGSRLEEGDPGALSPTVELATPYNLATNAATQEIASPHAATQQLPILPFQGDLSRRSVWPLVIPIVLITFAAVAYLLFDMHRSGAFLAGGTSTATRPSDPTPLPQLSPVPSAVPAAVAVATGQADAGVPVAAIDSEVELEPLTVGAARPVVSVRKRTPRSSPLQKEWTRARASFQSLERSRPCELPSMALLCSRYEDLKGEVSEAPDEPAEVARLLSRVKAFKAAVDQKASRR
ncbi:MAG: serine/threonine protein kinase [Myxococcota bacterium]|nr:serine/threonine protein kinase [Myxococcota bacterium]